MRRTDIEAVGEAAGEALAFGGGLIQDMHAGIAGRPFGILGPLAAPVRIVHDGVSTRVYGGLQGGLKLASRAGAGLLSRSAPAYGPIPGTRAVGAIALATINGLYGDHLTTRRNPLAMTMEARRHGAPVPVTEEGLVGAFPDATGRVAVFVHGLFETDEAWRHLPLRGRTPARRSYGERLQDELGFTPVELRYNTGLHVSDNGRALAGLLEDLVRGWPEPVEELVLVGHSMGGLVARSACHYGEALGHAWTNAVRHVFCLGTPHLGADLEKGLGVLGWAARRLPETRALGTLLDARSAGIKDLRFGACVEEDWCDCEDPDGWLRDRCREVPFLPGANYYFVGASLRKGPLGAVLGDLLVRIPSASGRGDGRGRSIPFEVGNGCELDGLTHFDLLNHPAVYEQLRTWILRRPAPARAYAGELPPAA